MLRACATSRWRAYLAVLRDNGADAECADANGADRSPAPAIGTIGTIGIGTFGGEDGGDHDAGEQDAMACFYVAPSDPHAHQPTDADRLHDGLLMMARATSVPTATAMKH